MHSRPRDIRRRERHTTQRETMCNYHTSALPLLKTTENLVALPAAWRREKRLSRYHNSCLSPRHVCRNPHRPACDGCESRGYPFGCESRDYPFPQMNRIQSVVRVVRDIPEIYRFPRSTPLSLHYFQRSQKRILCEVARQFVVEGREVEGLVNTPAPTRICEQS